VTEANSNRYDIFEESRKALEEGMRVRARL
jgi:hypothetical protein